MKVDQHISELLFDHDCVIVPSFGGFLASYNHAQIHTSQHTFYPPSKKIAFNIFLKQNDGLLANHISGHEKITYNEALHRLDRQVNQWLKELEQGNRLMIDRIGTFYLNSEKNLQFDPVKNINYLRDAFGFSTVQYLPVQREDYQERVEKQIKRIGSSRPSERQEKPTVAFSKKNRKKVFTMLIISGTLLWFSFNLYLIAPHRPDLSSLNPFESKNKSEVAKKEVAPVYQTPAVSEPKVETATGAKSTPDPITETASVSTKTTETVPVVAVQPPVTSNENQKYFIIGGAFQIQENAEAFVKTLQAEGFTNARILDSPKHLKMVCFKGFSARAEAVKELDSLKERNKNGWIYSK